MKDRICLFCKYQGKLNFGHHPGIIFQEKKEVRLDLCYHHSVDLFKSGQRAFMDRHHSTFEAFEILEDKSFTIPRRSGLFSY